VLNDKPRIHPRVKKIFFMISVLIIMEMSVLFQ
jgi:hypothetical protein